LQYALVDQERREAFPAGHGLCPSCGAAMVAKCGPRVMHHWAHAGRQNCDPWWENETAWHRAWKALFPDTWREVSHVTPDGEIHRADIKTATGIVIEIQHSSISDAERLSRESFYGNLVWVVDGLRFRENFDIYHQLPDPASDLSSDLVWWKAQRGAWGSNHGLFWRRSENPARPMTGRDMVESHGIDEIRDQIGKTYNGHHQYDWIRPHRTWLESASPVYIDFGGNLLVRLETYDQSGLPCIRYISKRKFVFDLMIESHAEDIAV